VLRIGTRDICLRAPIETITVDISRVAAAAIDAAYARIWRELYDEYGARARHLNPRAHVCIMAFGKLGGAELNYSSDIDLLGIYETVGNCGKEEESFNQCAKLFELLSKDLTSHTEEGHVYRVDLRLRPYGRSGQLVQTPEHLLEYYSESAALWEIQAALKLRPVAGNLDVGSNFIADLKELIKKPRKPETISENIERLRKTAIKNQYSLIHPGTDVKTGVGGIRDIEFLIQAYQLVYCSKHPELMVGNTMKALAMLKEHEILPEDVCDSLKNDYIFLRRVEHFLQILEDRQIHALPTEERDKMVLSKRIVGVDGNPDDFYEEVRETIARVRQYYQVYMSISN
jgi:glutamate-ammonia-ligase adenylyltransferase